MRKILFINSFSGGAQALISTVLVFFTIPVFIHKLGTELYGVFSLLLLIGNLNVFLNLGLNSSLIKYLAEQGKCRESDYDISVSFLILCAVLLPVTILGIVFDDFILRNVLNVPAAYITGDLKTLYICLFISNSLQFLGQISSAVIDSQQKIYLSNILQVLYNYSYWAFILLSLFLFSNFSSIGFSILFVNMVWYASVTVIARKIWGPLGFGGVSSSFGRIAKKQLGYGFSMFSSGIISFFYEPITKILLSSFVGINEVGFFDIALRMRNQIWNILLRLIYPFFPLISKMTDSGRIRSALHNLEQKIMYLSIPLIVCIMFLSRPFISLWIGKNVDVISTSFVFIVGGYLIGIIVTPTYMFLMAKGHPEKTVVIQLINVIVNAALFLATFRSLGYYAAVVGNTGAILASFSACLYYQHRFLNTFLFDSVRQAVKAASLAAVFIVAGYFMNAVLVHSLVKLVCIPVVFLVLGVVSFRALRLFSETDLDRYLGASATRYKWIIRKTLIR
jgi:O-antigen/teichoic acid export membrane protein